MYDLSLRHSFNLLGFSIICIQLYVNCFCFLMREMSHEVRRSHFSQQIVARENVIDSSR